MFDTIRTCSIKLVQGLKCKTLVERKKCSFFVLIQKCRPGKGYDNVAMYLVRQITENVLDMKSANGNSNVSTLVYHESGAV